MTTVASAIKPILLHADGIRDLSVGRSASHREESYLHLQDNGNGKYTLWKKSRGTQNVTIEEVWRRQPDGSSTLESVTEVVQPVKEWLLEFCPFKVGQLLRVKEAIDFRGPSYTPCYKQDGSSLEDPEIIAKLRVARDCRRVIPAKRMPSYAARFIVRITNVAPIEDVCDILWSGDRWKWGLTVELDQ